MRAMIFRLSLGFLSISTRPFMNSVFPMAFASTADSFDWKTAKSVYEFSAKNIDGVDTSLDKYQDKVVLIVNVASK